MLFISLLTSLTITVGKILLRVRKKRLSSTLSMTDTLTSLLLVKSAI
nr:MAG TPA_asm: hypothetical protein [Caudoviricetes sp.]